MLEVYRINKTYPKEREPAVRNINFVLKEREVLGLIGESGAGKTTMLKILAGILEADSGKVTLNNKLLAKPSEQLIPGYPEIQMVFQNFELAPNFTIYENVRHPVLFRNPIYKEKRVTEVLELCELTSLKDRFPAEISGGQQQRVALARAMVNEPKVLLLDEPFSNLDKPRRNRFLRLIRKITRETNIAVVFVTHEANDALAIADKLVVMRLGNIIQQETPFKIYHYPIDSYVARFFGEINIFPYADFYQIFGKESNELCNFFGIRPEHIYVNREGTSNVKAMVKDILFFGNFFYLSIEVFNKNITVNCTDQNIPKVGEWISLTFDEQHVKFFWE
ncbi:MAG: ABC transporter ATP-binding protein [Bacteroidota bacterium]